MNKSGFEESETDLYDRSKLRTCLSSTEDDLSLSRLNRRVDVLPFSRTGMIEADTSDSSTNFRVCDTVVVAPDVDVLKGLNK